MPYEHWPEPGSLPERARSLLDALQVDLDANAGKDIAVRTPISGEILATFRQHTASEVHAAIESAQRAFFEWRVVPAPKRGAVVHAFGQLLREHKAELGEIVSLETGKILSEGKGEVQELIDICDFAVGLSRQLYGLTIASERPGHRMMESWHPLGVCGVITAFNFPAAVWGWNAAIAFVCGDTVVWKPSEKASLTALACDALLKRACAEFPELPQEICCVLLGEANVAEVIVDHPRVPL